VDRRCDRVADVVQTVEGGDQAVGSAAELGRRGDLEDGAVGHAGGGGPLPGQRDRAMLVVGAEEGGVRYAWAISTVDAPSPQPTSATAMPSRSLASTPRPAPTARRKPGWRRSRARRTVRSQ
jgi:hypothetical protein